VNKFRLEFTDKIALAIAVFMIIGGFAALLLPEDVIVAHTSIRGKGAPAYTVLEHVTASRARMYGLGGVLAGALIGAYVLWSATTK
jgi:hypothetical protein